MRPYIIQYQFKFNHYPKSEHYGGFDEPYTDFRDIYHIADSVSKAVHEENLKETAEGVKKAIKDSVIANETAKYRYPNANGLSIYAPTNAGSGPEYNYKELNFAENTQWDEAIKSIAKSGKRIIGNKQKIPSVWPDNSVKPEKR